MAAHNVVIKGFQESEAAWAKGLAAAWSSLCRCSWPQCQASSLTGGQGEAKGGTEDWVLLPTPRSAGRRWLEGLA